MRVRSDSVCELVSPEDLFVPDYSDARRAAVRAFRPARVRPAAVTATLLALIGAAVAVQVLSTLAGSPVLNPSVLNRTTRLLASSHWHDPAVLATGLCAALAGLGLLLAAVLPGRTRTIALSGEGPEFVTGVRRSSLRAVLRAAALDVPGITEARVRVRGRWWPRAVVSATTEFRNPGNLQDMVAGAVRARLDVLDPVRRIRVAAHLDWRRD